MNTSHNPSQFVTSYSNRNSHIQIQFKNPKQAQQYRPISTRYYRRPKNKSHNPAIINGTQAQLFKHLPLPSTTLLSNILKSERFRLNGRPMFTPQQLSSFVNRKKVNPKRGFQCRTPEFVKSERYSEKPEVASTIIHSRFKSQEKSTIPQKSQTIIKREEPYSKRYSSFNFNTVKAQSVTMSPAAGNIQQQMRQSIKSTLKDKNKLTRPLLLPNDKTLPTVKSQSYCMMQHPSGQLILSHHSKHPLQIASLTKIMTCYLTIKLAQQHSKDLTKQTHIIGEHIEESTGTSAELIDGDCYTIEQLLYGLMLPSGNDAALALADWGGACLVKGKRHKENVKEFVKEMNVRAVTLGLKDTRFGNVHGLPSKVTKSTAYDICQLCITCLSIPLFLKIISTKHYTTTTIPTPSSTTRTIHWQNTNKLLRRPNFLGIKTGITVTAGPCLASAYTFRNTTYVLVLLRANKISRRFSDSRKVIAWAMGSLYPEMTVEERRVIEQLKKRKRDLDSDNSEEEGEFQYDKESQGEIARRSLIIRYEL